MNDTTKTTEGDSMNTQVAESPAAPAPPPPVVAEDAQVAPSHAVTTFADDAPARSARHDGPFITPQTFRELTRYAEFVAHSALVPKAFQGKPADIAIAMQWGIELGLHPLQAVQNIAVINGRPSLWGDALPAIAKAHASYEWIRETLERDATGAVLSATCVGKRKGHEPESRTFTIDDAKRAGLFGKEGPWKQYTSRMLQMRARAWLIRDLWPDALRGLAVAEEVQDYTIRDVTPSGANSVAALEARLVARASEAAQ